MLLAIGLFALYEYTFGPASVQRERNRLFMDNENVFTTCRYEDDWFGLVMQQDPKKYEFPSSFRFSFIEDGDAFSILGKGTKFANETEFVEQFTVTPTRIDITLSSEVTRNTQLNLYNVLPDCRLAFLAYVSERPKLAAKLVVQDHEG